ncbi:MAG: 16S rRNA (adenine(1518)-N(6)/adenine(1519)-N(6))-dimethyltransferase RsmA [Candidatus Kapabacteria bacterium]|nr:16S rRNA (adenine(1518)-N(6)/adenine(1519)-N(6))-dimethyltransferase RsmA [Candidatus Kapabacteria bacterium]
METLKAKKSLGQNFLIDKSYILKIIDLLQICKDDIVLEIGPGTGALTDHLNKTEATVYAVELDERAVRILTKKYPESEFRNFHLIQSDIRQVDLNELLNDLPALRAPLLAKEGKKKIKVIGNIPYYLSSEILFWIFEQSDIIESVVLTMQREVARRLVAVPSTKDYGILTLARQLYGACSLEFNIPAECFRPMPKVTSSVVKLDFVGNADFKLNNEIMVLIRTLFNQRRKMISNSIKSYYPYQQRQSEINPKISEFMMKRPEELSLEEFKELFFRVNDKKI